MPEADYAWLERDSLLSFEEFSALVDGFIELGVKKVRLTGGEPLLRRDLPHFVSMLARKPLHDLAMTTNGVLLSKYAQELKDAGLGRLTLSLDTLKPERFLSLTGQDAFERVICGLDSALALGFKRPKINCVLIKGFNDDEVIDFVEFARARALELRFIEYMDVGNLNKWDLSEVVSSKEILEIIKKDFSVQPLDASFKGEVATRYSYLSDDGIKGEIGIISSVTNPFCSSCTRARLTTDGKLVTCLFSNSGLDLEKEIRAGKNDKYIKEIITNYWEKRTDRYSELRSQKTSKNKKIEMYQLGG